MKPHKPHYIFLLLALPIILLSCNEETPVPVNGLVAKAGVDQNVQVKTVVTLDGSASTSANNQSFTFQWIFKNKPEESAAILQNATSAIASFTPDLPGLYTLQLILRQGDLLKTDEVSIRATEEAVPQPVTISNDISTDTELANVFEDPARADYLVTADVAVSANLIIAPGVVIEFENEKSLHIFPQGALIAKGTATDRVIFTGKVKSRGYWKGIVFNSNKPENELDHVLVAYGGSSPLPDMTVEANVGLAGGAATGAAVKISNSSFTDGAGYGLYVAGRSTLSYFSGNYFSNNFASALYVPAAQLHNLDFFSHYTDNNGYNGVETGGTVQELAEVTWSYFNDNSKYLVTSDIIVESGVKITEGAVFEFAQNIGIQVLNAGYLNATGTDVKPVVFTAREKTAAKAWKGILFSTGHEFNALHHTFISHAGFSIMNGVSAKANVAVTASGKFSLASSRIENGLGWGVVAEEGALFNANIITSNLYYNLAEGRHKLPFSAVLTANLAGDWVDYWSFSHDHYVISESYFDSNSTTWFAGAVDPWNMNPQAGFGLKINDDGSYVWTIAELSPGVPECVSYSAEYITGTLEASGDQLSFEENYWRSKFYNSCDTEQNVDVDVEPGSMMLKYEVNRMYNVFTGDAYWELKIINPDNTSFSYYKLMSE